MKDREKLEKEINKEYCLEIIGCGPDNIYVIDKLTLLYQTMESPFVYMYKRLLTISQFYM